jgi:hypothetical protein
MTFIPMRKFLGSLERLGIVVVWSYVVLLLPIGVAVFFLHKNLLGYAIITCLVISKLPFWSYDLCHTLLMQANVADEHRSKISSAQSAFYRIFWLLLSVLSMILSSPTQFPIMAFMSLCMVVLSAVVFTFWAIGMLQQQQASPSKPQDALGSSQGVPAQSDSSPTVNREAARLEEKPEIPADGGACHAPDETDASADMRAVVVQEEREEDGPGELCTLPQDTSIKLS